MKKISKILCIVMSLLMLFSVTGCKDKEITTENKTETEIVEQEKDNKNETYSNISLKLNKEKNFSLTILDRYKEILTFQESKDGKTIYITDKETNTIILKIIIAEKAEKDAIETKKVDSVVLSIMKGEEINDSYDTGKLLKEIQDNAGTIIKTAKIATNSNNAENNSNTNDAENNEDDENGENSTTDNENPNSPEENIKVEVEEKEDGTKIYHYTDENGETQEVIEYPDPMDQFKEENKKPIYINP